MLKPKFISSTPKSVIKTMDIHTCITTTPVRLFFTTCTVSEAVSELNLMLKGTGYPAICEDYCVNTYKATKEEDWFDDYTFVFETGFNGSISEITRKLSSAGVSFEFFG